MSEKEVVSLKAAVLYGMNDLRVKDVPCPQVTMDNEVLIKVGSVGVCGSDLHYYKEGKLGIFTVTQPTILGHECAGYIVEKGKEVQDLKVGDKVVVEPGAPCRKCDFCKGGRYNLCKEMTFLGTPPTNGCLVEYLKISADSVYPISTDMTIEEGAMVEPLAVGMHAVERGSVKLGDSVAILGCGTIGLMTLQAARLGGAIQIIAIDVIRERLELARQLGATEVINGSSGDTVKKVKSLTGGEGVDVTFECAGNDKTVIQCLQIVRLGGVVALVGAPSKNIFPVNMWDCVVREYDIRGVNTYVNIFPRAIASIVSRRVQVKPLITHRFPLEQITMAYNTAYEQKEKAIKVIINL